MAKFYGEIGYAEPIETSPGIWEDKITKRNYYGDISRESRMLQSADKLNDDINVNVQIRILADPFAEKNFHLMKYVEFMGTKWKITNVEPSRPRLILTLGGVYNGKQA